MLRLDRRDALVLILSVGLSVAGGAGFYGPALAAEPIFMKDGKVCRAELQQEIHEAIDRMYDGFKESTGKNVDEEVRIESKREALTEISNTLKQYYAFTLD